MRGTFHNPIVSQYAFEIMGLWSETLLPEGKQKTKNMQVSCKLSHKGSSSRQVMQVKFDQK